MTEDPDPHGPVPVNFNAPARRMTQAEANDPQRKRRSVMIAWALVAFTVLIAATTFVRLAENRRAAVAEYGSKHVATQPVR